MVDHAPLLLASADSPTVLASAKPVQTRMTLAAEMGGVLDDPQRVTSAINQASVPTAYSTHDASPHRNAMLAAGSGF
jgi:hypothetical protein